MFPYYPISGPPKESSTITMRVKGKKKENEKEEEKKEGLRKEMEKRSYNKQVEQQKIEGPGSSCDNLAFLSPNR